MTEIDQFISKIPTWECTRTSPNILLDLTSQRVVFKFNKMLLKHIRVRTFYAYLISPEDSRRANNYRTYGIFFVKQRANALGLGLIDHLYGKKQIRVPEKNTARSLDWFRIISSGCCFRAVPKCEFVKKQEWRSNLQPRMNWFTSRHFSSLDRIKLSKLPTVRVAFFCRNHLNEISQPINIKGENTSLSFR